MKNKTILNGEAANASRKETLAVELFLKENYLFRRNVLSGKVEFATLPNAEAYRVLTNEAVNSIVIRAKREEICEKGSPKTDIIEYVRSEEIPLYDPIADYLHSLPTWDGQNHVAKLLDRLPGLSTEQVSFMSIWLRSTVAHWNQMDTLHGNECVPTLIGAQGCGKSTFVQRLLPPQLRKYYLDHLNLSNRFDKEMALTSNLLVNLDELEAIRPSQQAALKQTISKNKVNSRPIYGCAQEDRPRYASFVATTNNPHPLTDATGSRRYICLTIPKGMFIDNTGDIDYNQLYAQLLYEVCELKAPFWFNNEEVARIQELNLDFMEQKDIADIVSVCFRKPSKGEASVRMNSNDLLTEIRKEYPSVKGDHSTKVQLGLAMKEMGFEHTECSHIRYYKVVPLRAA